MTTLRRLRKIAVLGIAAPLISILVSSWAGVAVAGSEALPGRVLPMRSLTPPGPVGLRVEEVPRHNFTTTTPPAGAPNVVIVLLDDVGYSASSTYSVKKSALALWPRANAWTARPVWSQARTLAWGELQQLS